MTAAYQTELPDEKLLEEKQRIKLRGLEARLSVRGKCVGHCE